MNTHKVEKIDDWINKSFIPFENLEYSQIRRLRDKRMDMEDNAFHRPVCVIDVISRKK
jgi:hypothetical protein